MDSLNGMLHLCTIAPGTCKSLSAVGLGLVGKEIRCLSLMACGRMSASKPSALHIDVHFCHEKQGREGDKLEKSKELHDTSVHVTDLVCCLLLCHLRLPFIHHHDPLYSLISCMIRASSLLRFAMSSSTNSPSSTSLISQARRLIPPLAADRHKGQAGRVCVVGGSRDYTGAPFFASMSSMLFGADMTFTLCHPDAGATIKTYSPDLIVQRVLDEQQGLDALRKHLEGLFPRVHALVLGPGLGRDDFMQEAASVVIQVRKHPTCFRFPLQPIWLWLTRLTGFSREQITLHRWQEKRMYTWS